MIKSVFAIVKDGRRLEDINYLDKESASNRLSKILFSRKNYHQRFGGDYNPKSYSVVELEKPNKIW